MAEIDAVGVDVGGTFTDVISLDGNGRVRARKVATNPTDQSAGVVEGVRAGVLGASVEVVVHGTTIATNAVLQRDLARTVMVVTSGFRDLLAIRRQDRPSLYDLAVIRSEPVVPNDRIVEVHSRVGSDGQVVTALSAEELERVTSAVARLQPEAVAISLLFGYAEPAHERQVAAALAERLGPEVPITVASELLPELREYERTSTCALNAAVAPVMGRYLSRLSARLESTPVRVMTSGGGTADSDVAAREPVQTLLSGPAAGVVGASAVATHASHRNALAFDMGGTSTDVCLILDGRPQVHTDGEIDGLAFRTPTVAIHTVGAGGGSIASIDAGGALQVGPRSAGAVPGPACYARGGGDPTVTDAHAAMGHFIGGADFGSGALALDVAAAERALATLPDGVAGQAGAAAGVVSVVRATMARALRRVSTEQGVDPRGLALVAYGGAGPLHACALARELGCPQVLVPPAPGVLSALGLLLAPSRAEASRTVMARLARTQQARDDSQGATPPEADDPHGLARMWRELEDVAKATLRAQRVHAPALRWLADLRYAGQAHELRVETDPGEDAFGLREALHVAHERAYGYRLDDADVEAVTLRVVAEGAPTLDEPPTTWDLGASAAPTRTQMPIRLADGTTHTATVIHRSALTEGEELRGPALVHQPDTTVLLEAGDCGRVDLAGTLVIDIGSDHD